MFKKKLRWHPYIYVRNKKIGNKETQKELLNINVDYLVTVISKPHTFKRKVDNSTYYLTIDLRVMCDV